jgi:pectate lyase
MGGTLMTGGKEATGGTLSAGGTNLTGGASSVGGSAGGSTEAGGSTTGGILAVGGNSTGGAQSSGGAATGGTQGATTGVVGKPIGFATQNGDTVGGKSGTTVTVKTFADLKNYAESEAAYTILVDGTISNGPNGGKVVVKSNKSIVGIGSTAFLNGIGLDIKGVSNIILQNFRISLIGVTTRTETAGVYTTSGPSIQVNGGDAIGISGSSKNIWIDHCEVFSEDPSKQSNIDLYDGLIDIKGQSGFITISWTYWHDHHKGGLVGASDADLFADRKVTYHHNYYKNVKLRAPMYRGSVGHFFNNYIVGAKDASEIRAGTCMRMEKNYYESLNYSIYTPADSPGKTERIDNIEVNRASRAYPGNCTADIPYSYAEVLTNNTEDVKTIVPQGAGVGKL